MAWAVPPTFPHQLQVDNVGPGRAARARTSCLLSRTRSRLGIDATSGSRCVRTKYLPETLGGDSGSHAETNFLKNV